MGRNRLLVFIVTSSFLSFSCAANRARVITPNEEEVQVLDGMVPIDFDQDGKADGTTDFIRGKNEQLDEQEFYQAIGDTASYETVKGSRGAGFALQGVGLAGMLLGVLGAGGGVATYFLSDGTDGKVPTIPVPEESRGFVLYGVYGAAALAVLGGVLFFSMAGKARGDRRVFELAHARSRLEVSLYGENGATPDDIKKLVFGQGNEASRVCVGGALQLAPLIAYDARGRKMKVVDRADWFTWLTTPKPELIERVPDAPLLHSSLDGTFADIDTDLGVAIKVAQTGVGHEMTFTHDFTCGLTFGRDGEMGRAGDPGDRGESGRSGSSSRAPQSGQRGHPGKPGWPGKPGPNVVAEVAWVTTAKRGRLAVLVVDGQGTVFDPKGLPVTVSASGGAGGQGGHGGRGGSGGSASGCMAGGDGGDGGTGGQGGTGGPGGSVVLRAADPELLRAVRLMASGGPGGRGGDAGSGGSRGTRGSCKKGFPPEGANGVAGAPGGEGGSGADGTTRTEVVALNQLSQIARFVAANPTLTLEAGDAPPQPKKRK